jgi:hypothetical protein
LDPYRQLIYTIGFVYPAGSSATQYLVGYSIISGELVTLSPLTVIPNENPDVRGLAVDSNQDTILIMNAVPTTIVSINPFLNTSILIYSAESTTEFEGVWAVFDVVGGYAYVCGQVNEGLMTLRKIQLSSGVAVSDVSLNGTSDNIYPYSFVWAPSYQMIFSIGFVEYGGGSALEVTQIDPETGIITFLNVLRYARLENFPLGALSWDDSEKILYVGSMPTFGVSIPMNVVMFGIFDTRFPEEYQVFHPIK